MKLNSLVEHHIIFLGRVKMYDIIYGIVKSVIDEDTFIMNVTEASRTNEYNYNKWEHIRVLDLEVLKSGVTSDLGVKVKLGNAIQGKKVSCTVRTKDTYGRIIANVRLAEI